VRGPERKKLTLQRNRKVNTFDSLQEEVKDVEETAEGGEDAAKEAGDVEEGVEDVPARSAERQPMRQYPMEVSTAAREKKSQKRQQKFILQKNKRALTMQKRQNQEMAEAAEAAEVVEEVEEEVPARTGQLPHQRPMGVITTPPAKAKFSLKKQQKLILGSSRMRTIPGLAMPRGGNLRDQLVVQQKRLSIISQGISGDSAEVAAAAAIIQAEDEGADKSEDQGEDEDEGKGIDESDPQMLPETSLRPLHHSLAPTVSPALVLTEEPTTRSPTPLTEDSSFAPNTESIGEGRTATSPSAKTNGESVDSARAPADTTTPSPPAGKADARTPVDVATPPTEPPSVETGVAEGTVPTEPPSAETGVAEGTVLFGLGKSGDGLYLDGLGAGGAMLEEGMVNGKEELRADVATSSHVSSSSAIGATAAISLAAKADADGLHAPNYVTTPEPSSVGIGAAEDAAITADGTPTV